MQAPLKVKLYKGAQLPSKQHEGDSGYDVCSNDEDLIIPPGEHKIIHTGLQFQIPNGYEIQVRSRSGLAALHGIQVLNSPGTIDSSYRGEVSVILQNNGKKDFFVKKGIRIAQIVIQKVESFQLQPVEQLEQFAQTSTRGANGFGSTGV